MPSVKPNPQITMTYFSRIVSCFFVLISVVVFSACQSTSDVAKEASNAVDTSKADRTVEIVFLQINDVYEILPVSNNKFGGLARVATIRKRLMEKHGKVVTVLGGDFFSPSVVGTAKVDGERLAGKHMVAVLNALGLDIATVGNHEFDLKEADFRKRIAEAEFDWVAGNVMQKSGQAFPGFQATRTVSATNDHGDTFTVGIVSGTITSNQPDYVTYDNPMATIRSDGDKLRGSVDAVVGLTHLTAGQDSRLAEQMPYLKLIMGGHEHLNMILYRGTNFTPIAKADANARSVYVHTLTFDPVSKDVSVTSDFVAVTEAIPDDPAVAEVANGWVEKAFAGFSSDGFDPMAVVATTTEELDGMEGSVRYRSTAMTRMIADAMRDDTGADLAFYNSGSIRIDDILPAGPVTQYDVLRVLPFPGNVLTADFSGAMLERAFVESSRLQGNGAFLQATSNVRQAPDGWFVDDKRIDPEATYRVAISDYLARGNENALKFIDVDAGNPEMKFIAESSDIRIAVINWLKKMN